MEFMMGFSRRIGSVYTEDKRKGAVNGVKNDLQGPPYTRSLNYSR